MLVNSSSLIGAPILSVQASAPIAQVFLPVVDPDTLKIIAFLLDGPLVTEANILDVQSIREYSRLGMVIDSVDDLSEPGDIIKIDKVLELDFDLFGLKVETKKGTKLGKIMDYTVTTDNFMVQQLIVKRPFTKSFLSPELTVPRSEIVEITDYKIIVKDEERKIAERAEKEDFIPNFVNPFRSSKQNAPVHAETDDEES